MRPFDARLLVRSLPLLVVAGLLAFALLGATDPETSGRLAVPDALYYPNCTMILESVPSEQAFTLNPLDGIAQPLGTTSNIAACSLNVMVPPTRSTLPLSLRAWDPIALAPDPTTVALRSFDFFLSTSISWPLRRFDFVPPVVLKSLPGVAESPRATVALHYGLSQNAASQTVNFAPAATGSIPPGYVSVGGGPLAPLPGANAAIAHKVCGGDQVLQNLHVSQSVVRVDSTIGTNVNIIAQRFRVPTRVQVYWAELAFVPNPAFTGQVGQVGLLDAQGESVPATSWSSALASAALSLLVPYPTWGSHFDFDRVAILEPNHDYWLWVATGHDYLLGLRRVSPGESPAFDAGVGECWYLNSTLPPWTALPGYALDFKIVGTPLDLGGVQPASTVTDGLRLRITPNPARGLAMVTWSGARGAVRFDVLDARGRRVARGEAGSGAEGGWAFAGTRADGRPLAAGVYFVRAVDGEGRTAVERLVLLR